MPTMHHEVEAMKLSQLLDELGGLTDKDYREGFLHVADVASQNGDLEGLEHLHRAMGIGEHAEADKSLMAILTETMAVGKEITLRKLCKLLDPSGKSIHVPEDWIGKGPGPG